ncbi:MAG: DUF4390 domain-containing protein [Rhodocyclaceae bacterium]|nr:DUF4390 domain-containing protein [Rhodocyclaceae bacterium]
MLALVIGLSTLPGLAHAGSIEPVKAQLSPSDDELVLSAEFALNLGPRLEEAVSRGVPLHFRMEFTLGHPRWYWIEEHLASRTIEYRLTYNVLMRQYRLSTGGLHQSFSSLSEALRVLSRVAALPVAPVSAVKPGESYAAALRLSLDKNQLPKPFQVDALADRSWQVEAKVMRWQFTAPVAEARQ